MVELAGTSRQRHAPLFKEHSLIEEQAHNNQARQEEALHGIH